MIKEAVIAYQCARCANADRCKDKELLLCNDNVNCENYISSEGEK